eukprot:TRINITY_DN4412_c0_g2_i1.p1 TRINITY_DN4412_c0_g2~~TRINITY_DN4412_c0_g2_i1.p1  ORF type:complete len:320 (+),score=27.95 TRINITY_DN4412_c0_g2_i1:63-962(+)
MISCLFKPTQYTAKTIKHTLATSKKSKPRCKRKHTVIVAMADSKPNLKRVDSSTHRNLSDVRNQLIRQEDTIIYSLIERAQFKSNDVTYQPGGIALPSQNGAPISLLNHMLRETEIMHGKIGRYASPDEHAFFPDNIPVSVLPPLEYPQVLMPGANQININSEIMLMYLDYLLPGIVEKGDDGNYGSTALCDVAVLQALSKRIHYGKFVAEAKFQSNEEQYKEAILNQDADQIMQILTDQAVEDKVVQRVQTKASVFGQDLSSDERTNRVNPELVGELYRQWVMPLTKNVQVQYLLKRI